MSTAPAPTPATTLTAAVYESLRTRYRIPDATDTFDAGQTVIRRIFVDLNALCTELLALKLDGTNAALPAKLLIFCDTLQVSENTPMLTMHLRIFARRLTGSGTVRMAGVSSVAFYADVTDSGTFVTFETPPSAFYGGVRLDDTFTDCGVSLRVVDRSIQVTRLLNYGQLREMPDTRQCLEQTYIYASLLYEENPALSAPLLRRIQRTTASWAGDIQNLYLQSSALLSTAELKAGPAAYVPWLAKEIYTKETTAFLAAAQKFEENYDAFRTAQTSLQDRAKYAGMMLRNYQDMTDVSTKLVAQARANFDDAEESVTSFRSRIKEQDQLVDTAKNDFKHGVIRYQREETLKFGLELTGAIISLGFAAGSIAFGMPDPKAIDSLVAAAKAGKAAADSAQALEKLAKTGASLKAACEALQKLVTTADRLRGIANMETPALDMSSIGAGETGDAEWEIFRDKVIEMMAPAIEEGIGGAVEYKLALLGLTSYGKSLNRAQAELIRTGQELSRLLLQEAMNTRQARRMAEYIEDMTKAKEPNEEMMRWLLERYGTVKRWLLLALQNYNDAFRYWALEEPAAKPGFNHSVAEIQEALGNIIRTESGVLQKFRPVPQSFHNYPVIVKDAQALEAFKKTRRLAIDIPLDNGTFAKNERVRLREMKVWLEGVASVDPVRLFISSSGTYADRYKGKNFAFATSWPVEWSFRYMAAGREIQMSAAFDEQFRAFYFEPTPFTTWTVSASDPNLDLSGLSRIVLEFSGSAIVRG